MKKPLRENLAKRFKKSIARMVGGSLVPLYIRPWPLGPADDNMEFALIKSRTAQFKLRFRN